MWFGDDETVADNTGLTVAEFINRKCQENTGNNNEALDDEVFPVIPGYRLTHLLIRPISIGAVRVTFENGARV